MQITRQADYAVRAILYLARLEPNQRAATSQIAEIQKIPPSFLAKIISQLSIAGLIHTSRGARGGVLLSTNVYSGLEHANILPAIALFMKSGVKPRLNL
jgi:Rrf2 family protein